MIVVQTTFPEGPLANSTAETLIREKLAACVQISAPITSVYEWDGKIRHSNEVQLNIKTSSIKLKALEKKLHELHPYEVPEFVIIHNCSTSQNYEQWVDSVL